MSSGVNVTITGTESVIRALRSFGELGEKRVDAVTKSNAKDIELTAKTIAAQKGVKDTGRLIGDIATDKIGDLSYQVTALAPYSAYQEFGTGRLVEVPDVFKDQAEQFRGAGIKKINIPARPFMYPAYLKARKQFPEELKDELDYLIKKFNK